MVTDSSREALTERPLLPRVWTRRSASTFASVLLAASLAGCCNEPVENLAVWSEFLSPAEVRSHLPTLARFGADLYLAVRPGDLGDELAALLEDARVAGVEVRAWLQLPDSGVWVNEENAAEFAELARQFVQFSEVNGLGVTWIIFDLEPPFELAEELREAAAEGRIDQLAELLARRHDPVRFETARQVLREAVDELHARDAKAMAVTLPWTIDDLNDGDDDLQDLFDTPLAGIAWDQVSVIVYRPALSELFGVRLPPGYVASYADSMTTRFGPDAQVAIGNISTPGLLVAPGYSDPFDVALDVSAARSAGINDVSLFSLDGMVAEGGPERWLAAASAPTVRFSYAAPRVAALRLALAALDRATDE